MMKHPDEFRQKIKVSDEEIGELEEIQETSIIETPRKISGLEITLFHICFRKMQHYLMSMNLDKLFGSEFFMIIHIRCIT